MTVSTSSLSLKSDDFRATLNQPSFDQAAASSLSHPLVVHSHLRWDWVWQRPQQFLSRLSRRHRILFVQAPEAAPEGATSSSLSLQQAEGFPNITIVSTFFPHERWFINGERDDAWADIERRRLLKQTLAGPLKGRFDNAVQWFYDPMAVTSFAGHMNEIATVYDCMDELSQFKGAPLELVQRERALLKTADVVFAGGRKMHESKSRYNPNCHFYGCGVDIEHFGKARRDDTPLPADAANFQGPVLGFFGVVDERIDLELLAAVADAEPSWNLVMVGPVTKIDAATLPQRPNIHWLGGRDYEQLPAYTKRFDVCLMPFALNEATEYINPTKALEYMATARPIVSSAVPDVVSNFSDVVKIAASHDEFIALCRDAVRHPDVSAVERGVQMANDNTWDAIVAKLEAHIDDALRAKSRLGALLPQSALNGLAAANTGTAAKSTTLQSAASKTLTAGASTNAASAL